MANVQNILPETSVQQVNSANNSQSNNSFQKILRTKSSNAETNSQDSSNNSTNLTNEISDEQELIQFDDQPDNDVAGQIENIIPMTFIPVLAQLQQNYSHQLIASDDQFENNKLLIDQNDNVTNVLADSKSETDDTLIKNSSDQILTNSLSENMDLKLPNITDNNPTVMTNNTVGVKVDLAAKSQNLVVKPPDLTGEGAVFVSDDLKELTSQVAVEKVSFSDEQDVLLNNKSNLQGDLNLIKNDEAAQNPVVVTENAEDFSYFSNNVEKNMTQVNNKSVSSDLKLEKKSNELSGKTTESKSFWENVSSRLEVRKENFYQAQSNMNNQSLGESNLTDISLNSKNISLANEKINQLFSLEEKDNILDQVIKKVEIDLKQGQTELRMQLKPENLGEVQMKVVVEDGKLSAHFVTNTTTAKEALESNVQQLKQNLQEQGVKVEKIAVLLSSGDLQFNQKQQDETMYQNQKINKNWRKSGTTDYDLGDEIAVNEIINSGQILSAEQIDYRA